MANSLEKHQAENIHFEVSLNKNNVFSPSDAKTKQLPDTEKTRQEPFDKLLVEAIDDALTSLGEPVKNTFYQHLENDFDLNKDQIPKKIDEFSFIIHKIFGLGASRLEIRFVKNLNNKLGPDVEPVQCEFSVSEWIVTEMAFKEHIDEMRTHYEMKVRVNH